MEQTLQNNQADSSQTQSKKILIVEDEASMLKTLVNKFEQEGFTTLQARDGEEGFFMAREEQPDLILLDIIMPKMDGLTMLKKLRNESDYGKEVPVILLTNLVADSDEIMKTVAQTEPTYYLIKANFSIQDVVEKARERLATS